MDENSCPSCPKCRSKMSPEERKARIAENAKAYYDKKADLIKAKKVLKRLQAGHYVKQPTLEKYSQFFAALA